MSSIWEIMAVTVLIGGAAAYLGRRIWRTFSGSKAGAGCDTDCGGCTHNQPSAAAKSDLVSLDSLQSSANGMSSARE